MTKDSIPGIIAGQLIEDQPDVSRDLLRPLLAGKPVWLAVEDRRLPKKRRKYEVRLLICPAPVVGVDLPLLLVSMPPYGSEMIDPSVDLRPTAFARIGLSFSLSRALCDALKALYGGITNG